MSQSHLRPLPRCALDIFVGRDKGCWPLLPIKCAAPILYLKWNKSQSPSYMTYVNLVDKYYGNKNLRNFFIE